MAILKTSLICTVLNEENSVESFINSVLEQTIPPSELIIVDGGSVDETISKIKRFIKKYPELNIKLYVKKGNRSVGRNEAIRHSSSEVILCTDSGCVLDRNWIKEITKPFRNRNVEVVAGYYKGEASNVFEKSLVPYVLVMPDKINLAEFLPASRSMAFKKSIWKKAGGFDEGLSHNEDYAFANKLKEINAKIFFKKTAIVKWMPRENLFQAFRMFFRFAFGDGESGILRNKVILIFARYFFYLYLIILNFLINSSFLLSFTIFFPIVYISWAIYKNYRYVKDNKALIILPVLQITSDLAVLTGTILGIVRHVLKINYKFALKQNLLLIVLISAYVLSMISVVTTGIPNSSHPFPYQIDEWHQMQSVRNVFRYGTPNLEGSANGTMFHFFITGILLIPFYLLKIIDPFMIKSAVESLPEQEKLFITLRLTTLFFGVLTLINISKISKLLKTNTALGVFMFLVTPAWLVLSNFFKYDIGLMFWITLALLFFIKYYYFPSPGNFILSSFFSAVAFSVKVTGVMMIPVLFLSYFLFTPGFNKKYLVLGSGLAVFVVVSIFLGIPDLIFGGRSLYVYLFENLILLPNETATNIRLYDSLFNITVFHKMPLIFGHVFFYSSIFLASFLLISSISNFAKKKYNELNLKIFLLISLIMHAASLIPLNMGISANRALVLLPFIVVIDLIALKEIMNTINKSLYLKKIMVIFIVLLSIFQIAESYMWIKLKLSELPQQASSAWIKKNIPINSNIGLENVPIYQFEPDIILKEFYLKQYNNNYKAHYNYYLVDSKTEILPEYLIISNAYYEQKYYIKSDKNALVSRLKKMEYKEVKHFPLNLVGYKIFDNDFTYPAIGLYAYPQEISIYMRQPSKVINED